MESNRAIPDSLKKSPLVTFFMMYDTLQRVCSTATALRIGMAAGWKALKHPTRNGDSNLKERFTDWMSAAGAHLGVSAHLDHVASMAYSNRKTGYTGVFERLYNRETDPEIKSMFQNYVKRFL
jgi:hypothetical protein